jgi:hypothetical protein
MYLVQISNIPHLSLLPPHKGDFYLLKKQALKKMLLFWIFLYNSMYSILWHQLSNVKHHPRVRVIENLRNQCDVSLSMKLPKPSVRPSWRGGGGVVRGAVSANV